MPVPRFDLYEDRSDRCERCDADEFRVLATGSRHAKHDGPIVRVMNQYWEYFGARLHVAAGGATGVDTLVERWAKERGVRFRRYAVDHAIDSPWPAAGPRRNKRMHDDFRPHEVAAFPGGRGTGNMMAIARAAGTRVNEIRYTGDDWSPGVMKAMHAFDDALAKRRQP